MAQYIKYPVGSSVSIPSITGTLTTITTDTVTIPAPGSQLATVKVTVINAGTSTATAQISLDGGFNWISAVYGLRVVGTAGTVNITNIALTTGNVLQFALPGNCTHFRFLCAATGTISTITIAGDQPYVPGVPVTATLYDALSGSGAAIVQAFDGSGWSLIAVNGIAGGAVTSLLSAGALDGTGTAYNGIGNNAGMTIAANSSATIFLGTPLTSTSVPMGNTAIGEALPYLPPRFSATVGISASQVNRLIVLARR